MWKKTFSKVYKEVKKEDVWNVWTDVNNWPLWHSDLDSCVLEGDFKVGNHFKFKPKGQNAIKITLTDIQPHKSFTDCTKFFGARMCDTHIIEEVPGGVRLTSILTVVGFLTWLWVFLVAKNVAATVPDDMEALIKFVKEKS